MNNISSHNVERIMKFVLTNRNDWSDIGICLLWGISAFLHEDSVRKSTSCDIFLDYYPSGSIQTLYVKRSPDVKTMPMNQALTSLG